MGRELQKRKARSSISKARRKPKSKKRILNNHIIAANWDKSQTLAQNYRRLGLTTRLNKNTGGVEKTVKDLEQEHDDGHGLLVPRGSTKAAEKMNVQEAQIERDPKTGKILRVIDDGSGNSKGNPLNDPLNELDSESETSQFEGFDQHGSGGAQKFSEPKTAVVQQLEREASKPVTKYKRKQSEGERAFIEALVEKYGDDYAKMARDMKINYMQRSEGDLKRRVKKWKESSGMIEVP